jgi:hypothetical protein
MCLHSCATKTMRCKSSPSKRERRKQSAHTAGQQQQQQRAYVLDAGAVEEEELDPHAVYTLSTCGKVRPFLYCSSDIYFEITW